MIVRVPYRWLSTIVRNLSSMWSDITQGISNIIRWIPVIWFDRDWDWSHLARVMEFKLSAMAKLEETYGHHVGSKRDAQRMRVCVTLLKRLQADEYFENAGYRADQWPSLPTYRKTQIARHAQVMRKKDLRLLGSILGKYMTGWWD